MQLVLELDGLEQERYASSERTWWRWWKKYAGTFALVFELGNRLMLRVIRLLDLKTMEVSTAKG